MRALPFSLMMALPPASVSAQTYLCDLEDGTPVQFVIDRNQFIDAITPEEPIRRKVTSVQLGADRMAAEPFIIGQTRGFHAQGPAGSLMFVVQPDGRARFANVTTGETRAGLCEDR